ncbi:MAG: hypothetical protein ABJA57_04230 [Ginsengibacter sp.]
MKKLTKTVNYKSLVTFLMLCFLQSMAWAQDSTSSTTHSSVTTETHTWYTEPWVWIVGGAVLLLLLVALLRGGGGGTGGSRTDKVTYTKTESTDTDTV